jgi:hypothetical protein
MEFEMGKASSKKKMKKAVGSNNTNQLAFSIDFKGIYEQIIEQRRDEACQALYRAVVEHNPEKIQELIQELEALGVDVYDETFIVETNNGDQVIDILQAALMSENEEIFTYMMLDAISKEALSGQWAVCLYEGPDILTLPSIRKKMMRKMFQAFLQKLDLLNFLPTTIEGMKEKMGPKALEIFGQVIGEMQAKFDQEALIKCFSNVDRESANDAGIAQRRKSKTL